MDQVINSGCNMTFTENRTIGLVHVDAEADLIRVLWFWCDNKGGYPRGWVINRFNNTLAFKFAKFMERDSPMWLRHGGYRSIDMEMNLKILHLANAVKKISIFRT